MDSTETIITLHDSQRDKLGVCFGYNWVLVPRGHPKVATSGCREIEKINHDPYKASYIMIGQFRLIHASLAYEGCYDVWRDDQHRQIMPR